MQLLSFILFYFLFCFYFPLMFNTFARFVVLVHARVIHLRVTRSFIFSHRKIRKNLKQSLRSYFVINPMRSTQIILKKTRFE